MNIEPVSLDMDFRSVFAAAPAAYERLICDVLRDDATLFPRREEIELSWQLIDPVLAFWAGDARPDSYESGSAGPDSAAAMLGRSGRVWRPL